LVGTTQKITVIMIKHSLSLPSLIRGLGGAKSGISKWRQKVAQEKIARSNVRKQAIRSVKKNNLIIERVNKFDEENDLRYEGDLQFYNDESLIKRERLRNNKPLMVAIDYWWEHLVIPLFDKDGDGNIQRNEYKGLYRVLLQSLTKLFHLKKKRSGKAAETALLIEEEREWTRDSGGQNFIDKDRFRTVIFELVDMWCDDINSEAYVKLTHDIFNVAKGMNKHLFDQKESKRKSRNGAPLLSKGVGLRYKSFDIYQAVLEREREREREERKLEQTWKRGISRLRAHNTLRLLIKSLKKKGEHEIARRDEGENCTETEMKVPSADSVANNAVHFFLNNSNAANTKNIDSNNSTSNSTFLNKINTHSVETRKLPSSPSPITILQPWVPPKKRSKLKERVKIMEATSDKRDETLETNRMKPMALSTNKTKRRKRGSMKKKSKSVNCLNGQSIEEFRNCGRISTSRIKFGDLKRYLKTKGGVRSDNKVHFKVGTRKKELKILNGIDGDALVTRQSLCFIEQFGGIATKFTTAPKAVKNR
jgi:hypothetical protein